MGRILPHSFTARGAGVTIWGDTDKVNELFPDLEPDGPEQGGLISVQVRATQVRRYPGATPFTRRAHIRTLDADKGIGNKATPGRKFWIEAPGLTDLQVENGRADVKQFTFEGPFYALKDYVFNELPEGWTLRSPGGRAFIIKEPAGPALPPGG